MVVDLTSATGSDLFLGLFLSLLSSAQKRRDIRKRQVQMTDVSSPQK